MLKNGDKNLIIPWSIYLFTYLWGNNSKNFKIYKLNNCLTLRIETTFQKSNIFIMYHLMVSTQEYLSSLTLCSRTSKYTYSFLLNFTFSNFLLKLNKNINLANFLCIFLWTSFINLLLFLNWKWILIKKGANIAPMVLIINLIKVYINIKMMWQKSLN